MDYFLLYIYLVLFHLSFLVSKAVQDMNHGHSINSYRIFNIGIQQVATYIST